MDPDHSLEGWYVELDRLLLTSPHDDNLDRVQLDIRSLLRNIQATHEASAVHAASVASAFAVSSARYTEMHDRVMAVLRHYEVINQRRT